MTLVKGVVTRRGRQESYDDKNGPGKRWNTILLNEEGTSISTIVFNANIARLENMLAKEKIYFITNGIVQLRNAKFPSAHETIELQLTSATNIEKTKSNISLDLFRTTFVQFEQLKYI